MRSRIETYGDVGYTHYSMLIQWDTRDQIYVAIVPELLGCMTHGKTYEEAVSQCQDAIETWIEGSEELGLPVPQPKVLIAESL